MPLGDGETEGRQGDPVDTNLFERDTQFIAHHPYDEEDLSRPDDIPPATVDTAKHKEWKEKMANADPEGVAGQIDWTLAPGRDHTPIVTQGGPDETGPSIN